MTGDERAGRTEQSAARDFLRVLEDHLLGGEPTLTSAEVARRTGVEASTAKQRWRSLGFTDVPDDEPAFADADVRAMRLVEELHERGLFGADDEDALIRTMGRSFARLAEWQVTLLERALLAHGAGPEEMARTMAELTPAVEEVMDYVWRRHTLAVASRRVLSGLDDQAGTVAVVGFADIVGYTRRTREMDAGDLVALVDGFESRALQLMTRHGARIIKTIGDEVLFVAEDPAEAARIGLALARAHRLREDFPELRVGLAHGRVMSRLGDVYGPVVNLASRLTSVARPGTVCCDQDLADCLRDHDEFVVRPVRRKSVKGYRRLEPWSLRAHDPDALTGLVDQMDPDAAGTSGPADA